MSSLPIAAPQDALEEFCRRNHVRRLSLFGSVLGPRFRPDSDVDILVEFYSDHIPTLFDVARMERELSQIYGRKADLRTAEDLSRHFRHEVLASALIQYESR